MRNRWVGFVSGSSQVPSGLISLIRRVLAYWIPASELTLGLLWVWTARNSILP